MNHDPIYLLESYDFELPEELIAQYPTEKRGESRLFILNRKTNSYVHERFSNIVRYINENDILVFNDAKVIPARIYCSRSSGASIELVLTRKITATKWEAICNRLKRIKVGENLYAIKNNAIIFTVREKTDNGIVVESSEELSIELLHIIGEIPLPPYIQRAPDDIDYDRYQTVYAKQYGAVASPTAGLHFTNEILEQIEQKGACVTFLTLYVSWGTFQPVRVNDIRQHAMHTEDYYISQETVEKIYCAKSKGGRVIAVGTTSLRVLESVYRDGEYIPGSGSTSIFIYPPYQVKSVDALITNFHTPKSTLMMLVAAFAGYTTIMDAYKEAIKQRYRFFSYGDAMFII